MEQNNYGGKNYQIKAEKIGWVGDLYQNSSVTGQELLNRGIQLLKNQAYREAIDVLSDATKTDPSLSDAYYYLAIALLSGKKPKKTDGWTITSIEEKLNSAVYGDATSSKSYVLWAIVKYGYYVMNGFIENPPTSAQLFSQGESIQAEHAREILYYLNDPQNRYWMYLHNKFGITN